MLIQNARWGRLLQALSGTRSGGGKVTEFSPVLQPVYDIDRRLPEMDIYAGVKRVINSCNISGGVATFPQAYYVNPVGSGVMVTIESAFIGANLATAVFSWLAFSTDLPAGAIVSGSYARFSDRRLSATAGVVPADNQGVLDSYTRADANPVVSDTAAWYSPAIESLRIPHLEGVVLPPGHLVGFWTNTVNHTLITALRTRERPMEKGESAPT